MSAIHIDVGRSTQWKSVPMMRPANTGGDGAAPDAVDMAVLRAFEEIQGEGEPDLIVELINLFLKDAPVKLASIQEAAAEGDAGSLRRAAHSLKGSSACLGVGHVATLCEELECAYRADSAGQAAALVDRLERELEGALLALDVERKRRS
jgi:HPt (histidine-containing phosphotransfer) domain-containing protein